MARKYDRYGLNRQYKAKPCSKRYPFPYPLPFVDDFGLPNQAEKAMSIKPNTPSEPGSHHVFPSRTIGKKPTRDEVMQDHAKKRAMNVARKLAFEHPMSEMKKHQLTRRERRMNAAFYYIAGSILTGGIAGEIAMARPAARLARKGAIAAAKWRRRMDGGRYHMD